MNTITDDQGNKWQFIEIFNHEIQQYVYTLQPVPLKDGETWVEIVKDKP